jgi:virginiamycin B lyase
MLSSPSKRGVLTVIAAGMFAASCSSPTVQGAERAALLHGQVRSAAGQAVAGVTVRAKVPNKNIFISVFSDKNGRYAYRDLEPGLYSVDVWAAGFQPIDRQVNVDPQKPAEVDFTLQSRPLRTDELSTTQLLMSLPGTDAQKDQFAGCSNCHSLQFVLSKGKRTRERWLSTIEKMRGINTDGGSLSPERANAAVLRTRDANNRLADYLVSVLGPDSPPISYKQLPLPDDDAYSRTVIAEYRIPRGNTKVSVRGDQAGAWLHDVVLDSAGFIWYSDHFTNVLGRLDPKSGEVKEFPFPHMRPGSTGGTHKLVMDRKGNIWLAAIWQGVFVKFDPRAETFRQWKIEDPEAFQDGGRIPMVETDSRGFAYASTLSGSIFQLNPETGKIRKFTIPSEDRGIYGLAIDSNDVLYYAGSGSGKVGRFDPRTEKFTEWPVSAHDAFPRREQVDGQNRFWFTLFNAGKIGVVDPKTDKLREWTVSNRPYTAPYDVDVDDKNQVVWTTDFNSNRVIRFDIKTEHVTEFLLPEPDVEIRQLLVDSSTNPPTLWIPDYTPPGKILKIQVW